ncbi:MAG: hypothetical protein JRJ69_07140 [Deltaproteobacteria bacterium]|nr:hypothetical protein [Deltaproteobacteria bacterium]MBW1737321.1 hypothetical protein [Deltaproteobacteria bacterium]MBW1910188.1 hypothetical protein [Deltaproteobacteria bacterium]MBW2032870.1 hypothetical protein [Deltaproteobacteria bacterium]MBW2114698.1 hypothetical protein [Deltaproteobacteria bacterium]
MAYSFSLRYLDTSLVFKSAKAAPIDHISFIYGKMQENSPSEKRKVYTIKKGIRGYSLIHNKNRMFRNFGLDTAIENIEISIEMTVVSENPGVVFFHAGTVSDMEGNISLIAAESGEGKTTLCAMLAQRGLFSEGDELVGISPEMPLRPIPFKKALKVRKESLPFLMESGKRLIIETEKRGESNLIYWLPDNIADTVPETNKEIRRVFFLRFSLEGPNSVSHVSAQEAIKRLADACHDFSEKRSLAMGTILFIVNQAEIIEIAYNHPDYAVSCIQDV